MKFCHKAAGTLDILHSREVNRIDVSLRAIGGDIGVRTAVRFEIRRLGARTREGRIELFLRQHAGAFIIHIAFDRPRSRIRRGYSRSKRTRWGIVLSYD